MFRNLVKKFLPKRFLEVYANRKKNKAYLKITSKTTKITTQISKITFILFSATRFSSSLYYLFFSRSFYREHNKVLKGKLEYINSLNKLGNSQPLLRRNIHRLEKGLVMIPRRSIFALDYIEETVEVLEKIIRSKNEGNALDDGEIKWAFDVLDKYFSVTSNHEIIDSAKQKFDLIRNQFINTENQKFIPFARLNENRELIPSFEQIAELAKFRKSVRWFKQQKVPRELIDKAIEIGAYAPSACNRQPYEFRVIDDPSLIKKVASLPKGTVGYYQNVPMLIVIIGKLDAYFSERDRHLIYIDSSLAIMSFIFALETLGLSSCCINWPDIEHLELRMEKILKLKNHERPVMCLAVGYADEKGLVPYSKKKELNNIRRYN